MILLHCVSNEITSTTPGCKGNRRGKITLTKRNSLLKRYLTYDVTMMSQLKHFIMLNMFIGNYSGTASFVLVLILIIMIHRFTLYMQGKWENQKMAITLQHIFWHINIYSIDNSKTHYICDIVDLISTQNV